MEEAELPEVTDAIAMHHVLPTVATETTLARAVMAENSQQSISTTNATNLSPEDTTGDEVNESSQVVMDSDHMMHDAISSAVAETETETSTIREMHIDENPLEPEIEAMEMLVVERDPRVNDEREEQGTEQDPLVSSDAEEVVEEERESGHLLVEEEPEDMQEFAVDMVFNMYDREVEAAAVERRHSQINTLRSESVENRDRFNFPIRSQQLLQIRRALLVIDSNRRLRSGQRVISHNPIYEFNNAEGAIPAVEREHTEQIASDGQEQEIDVDAPENPDIPENPIRFDTNLAAEHSYLGPDMNRVSGVEYLDVGEEYNMMLFLHQHIVYPGEVLPFMISGTIIDADVDSTNGMLFGVCFPFLRCKRNENSIYGVTCQIYEKGTDKRGHTVIKSRALQRFITTSDTQTEHLEYINDNPRLKLGHVQILPEIYLPEPLNCIHMGSFNRFRGIPSMERQFQRYQAATTSWPVHIYNYYNISSIVEKARASLAQHEIDTMPTDPTQLSFWLARNLHLSEEMMKKIFTNDTVNLRMKLIGSTLQEVSIFVCRICGNRIADCNELFAMSKHGVQTQYCNSAGYIHETNTVYHLLRDSISYSGEPSSDFSWFPGYKWHIIVCKVCTRHIGWEFRALEPNLVPKSFFGISSSSVRVSDSNGVPTNPREEIFRNFMRLARRDLQ